jgi:hypothetical protein
MRNLAGAIVKTLKGVPSAAGRINDRYAIRLALSVLTKPICQGHPVLLGQQFTIGRACCQ